MKVAQPTTTPQTTATTPAYPAAPATPKDSSMTAAVQTLETSKGTVSGQAMMNAIVTGAKDHDNQAAGLEFAEMSKWVGNNQPRLSPEAKQVYGLYEKAARTSLAQGKTGIPDAAFKQLVTDMQKAATPRPTPGGNTYEPLPPSKGDASAAKATAELKAKLGQISGNDMTDAIAKGTADLDGQAAGAEFKEFQKFAKENGPKLSAEAKEVMGIYTKYAKAAQAQGQTGIAQTELSKMLTEMRNVKDSSATKALAELDKRPGPISGEEMTRAIQKGAGDLDGQAAGAEYTAFKDWSQVNQAKLSPEAKQVMELYKQHAEAAKANGTGIPLNEWNSMLKEMKSVGDLSAKTALAELDKKAGPITGDELANAIDKGTADLDGQAVGKEFKEFDKWAKANEAKLSPEAKEVMKLYREAAAEAKTQGRTGLTEAQRQTLFEKMKNVGDVGAKKALAELDKKDGTITGEELTNAIDKGTADKDGQAVGKEFKEFDKWAKANEAKLSPEAKEVMKLYRDAAAEAKAQGRTGLSDEQRQALLEKMKNVSTGDVSAKKALAGLDGKTTVSGDEMMRTIRKGISDKDGQAAGKEFAEFEKWAKANQAKLSPEAKEVMDIYKKYAGQAKQIDTTDLSEEQYQAMFSEMRNVGDVSARNAVAELDKTYGPISGEDLAKAIKDGTSDLDGNSSTKELKAFQQWAKSCPDRLTPEAKQVLATFEKYAKAAGKTGISQADHAKMLTEMEQFKTYSDDTVRAALDPLNKQSGLVIGGDLIKAITQGAGDADGQAAGLEHADFVKWAGLNKDRLSPDAQLVLSIYERYANRSLAAGQTGIPQSEWTKMLAEMKNVGMDRFKAFITG
jgi:hypothetical protein